LLLHTWALTIVGGSSHAKNAIKHPIPLEGSTVAQTKLALLSTQIPREYFSRMTFYFDLSGRLLLNLFTLQCLDIVCALSEVMAQPRQNLCSLIELQRVLLASH
jgi:hypothetical protein